ncbi:MAG: carbohydrate-binding protein [Hydrogeniiclostridium mannosilyticum]
MRAPRCASTTEYTTCCTPTSAAAALRISYAMSRSPLGPFTKGGVVIDNTGCDPKNWNDHGCIAEFNGSWYVFYHRATNNSCFSRRACAEPITFTADGRIPEVEMTTQGTQGPLSPLPVLEAGRACLLSGAAYIESRLEQGVYQEYLSHIQDGNWAAYKYFDFGQAAVSGFTMAAANGRFDSVYSARVELDSIPRRHADWYARYSPTGGWTDWRDFSCPVQPVQDATRCTWSFTGTWGGFAR